MGALITVDPCQKSFRYADTHPSENAILITLHQVDTHPQEKCDRPCNEIVGALITFNLCQKCLDMVPPGMSDVGTDIPDSSSIDSRFWVLGAVSVMYRL